eukprot:Hpha_TRINITY_DN15428_c0_g1::TRINITY_DN15428_c0_g1_i1::g.174026::m.174026
MAAVVVEHEQMDLGSPTFRFGDSSGRDTQNYDDGSETRTNSTGDDGAAERAASAVLELGLINRRKSSIVDVGSDGPGTGQATPEGEKASDDAGVGSRLQAASSQLSQQRRGSLQLSRNGSIGGRKLSAIVRRPSLQSRRRSSASSIGQQPDALPSDCVADARAVTSDDDPSSPNSGPTQRRNSARV